MWLELLTWLFWTFILTVIVGGFWAAHELDKEEEERKKKAAHD